MEKGNEPGKEHRLNYLINLLQLPNQGIDHIRYQLLHRTASAVIAAKSFHCNTAMVLVHSFSQTDKSFDDYAAFLKLYNLNGKIDGIAGPIILNGINTYWGWVKDKVD